MAAEFSAAYVPDGTSSRRQSNGGALEEGKDTVVSFVIKDTTKTGQQIEGKGKGPEDDCEYTVVLSTLYALVLILVGLAFPVFEALQHTWMRHHETGIFLAYLYIGSVVFLVYLQISLSTQTKRERKKKAKAGTETIKDNNETDAEKTYGSDNSKNDNLMLVRLRKLIPGSRPISRLSTPTSSLSDLSMAGQLEMKDAFLMREMSNKARKTTPNATLRRKSAPIFLPEQTSPPVKQRRLTLNIDLAQRVFNNGTRDNPPLSPISPGNNSPMLPDSIPNTPSVDKKSLLPPKENILSVYDDEISVPTGLVTEQVDSGNTTLDSIDFSAEDESVYEQYVLMEQTSTLAHEGASFYLRMGCVVFGIGNIVFLGTSIHANMSVSKDCGFRELIYPHWLHLLFLLVQTFFIFKYNHVHVRKHKGLVRFGLLHILATNLCVWIRMCTKEVLEAFEKSASHDDFDDLGHNTSNICLEHFAFMHKISPYLFPFVLEYSLIAVAVMASIFHNLNLHITADLFASIKHALKRPNTTSDAPLHGDRFFSKSHRGLYLGVLGLSASILSIILFLYSAEHVGAIEAVQIYYGTAVTGNFLIIIAVCLAFYYFRGLQNNYTRDNSIDNVLLLVSLGGLLLLHFISIMGCVGSMCAGKCFGESPSVNALSIFSHVMNIIQGLFQTTFVMSGLQKCSPSKELQEQKPGRGVVTFLVITNVAQWVFRTFQVKELSLAGLVGVYGPIAWPLIMNITLPLQLFFHFHSSVCLADIWSAAYEMQTGPKYRTL